MGIPRDTTVVVNSFRAACSLYPHESTLACFCPNMLKDGYANLFQPMRQFSVHRLQVGFPDLD